jgi:hypothetical protein
MRTKYCLSITWKSSKVINLSLGGWRIPQEMVLYQDSMLVSAVDRLFSKDYNPIGQISMWLGPTQIVDAQNYEQINV